MQKNRDYFTFFVWFVSYFIARIIRLHFWQDYSHIPKSVLELKRPVVFVSNHTGMFDGWIIFPSLPFNFVIKQIPIRILAGYNIKSSNILIFLKNFKIVNLIYFLYNCVTVPKDGTKEEKITPLINVIKSNYSTLIFPEGRIIYQNGDEIGEIKSGISILRNACPDVPFVFCRIRKIKHRYISFLYYKKVYFSEPSYENKEDYLKYTKDILTTLI